MKQKNLKRTLTAALLTLITAAAYGQTNTMTADIPFAFHAVGSNLPAGRYQVAPATISSGVMKVRNLDTGKTVYVSSKVPITEYTSDPKMRTPGSFSSVEASRIAHWQSSGRARVVVSNSAL